MAENERHPLVSTQKYISFPDLSNREDIPPVENKKRSGKFGWHLAGLALVILLGLYLVYSFESKDSLQAPGKFGVHTSEEEVEGLQLSSGIVRYFIIDENGVVYIIEDEMKINNYGFNEESSLSGDYVGCDNPTEVISSSLV